ncbi:ribosome maturation factor RimP [Occultella glacieicola]|uniref:Ribosome maturation factor RimP n=1 Tax=Occultella glacieicola TaxID=2518684 RepID=A0ABY2DWP9_9MICO|nr:ribosome maturation factor RimP [Occultella glacieicola]TDE88300.1 ribosome maturation factor RimP [Occultella glacieicola]
MSRSQGPGADVGALLFEALEPVVAGGGLFLEDVSVVGSSARRVVQVTVDLADGPGGVGSDLLADVSRAVSARLDEVEDLIDGTYLLEVSTPGVSRPLTEPRHFRRAVGRLVTLTTSGGTLAGRIRAVEADGIVLEPGEDRPEAVTVPLTDVVRGTVEVDFRRVDDAQD